MSKKKKRLSPLEDAHNNIREQSDKACIFEKYINEQKGIRILFFICITLGYILDAACIKQSSVM